MAVKVHLRSAAVSDTGRRRRNNEDRYYVDSDRGIYAVIDGVGGHAAGERAAQVAVEVLRERLERPAGSPAERLREAIALANNEIYRLSRTRVEWNGMACVLTIALIEDDTVTVGHVGDTRLYLLRAGEIHKVTHDHSPVGEREDRGEIGEAEAMRHSRRNEIYRDVGSAERNPEDAGFIELTSFPMPSDGALLLCSDGLTDLVSGEEIRAGAERYAPDVDATIAALVDAANHAGGKDNITVVMIAGPEYAGDTRITGPIPTRRRRLAWAFLVYGLLLGIAAGILGAYAWQRFAAAGLFRNGPRILTVGPGGIGAAMRLARAGDTVVIPRGVYQERIELRQGVTLRSQQPESVTLTSPDGGPAVVARKIDSGTLEGVWIQGEPGAPLSRGIEIVDASPVISNVSISGAQTGIEVSGASAPLIASSRITKNLGAGIAVSGDAKPRIERNLIAANGKGIELDDQARPIVKDNAIVQNGAEPISVHGRSPAAADFAYNYFGGLPGH